MNRFSLLAALTAIGFALTAGPGRAQSNYDGGWWTTRPLQFTVDVSAAGAATANATARQEAVAAAARAWNAAIGAEVIVTTNATVSDPRFGDGASAIYFANAFSTQNGTSSFSGEFAHTATDQSLFGEFYESDLVFNPVHAWAVYAGALQLDGGSNRIPDLYRVALHEMGHSLGLRHPDSDATVTIMRSEMTDLDDLQAIDLADAKLIGEKLTAKNRPVLARRSVTANRATLVLRGTCAPFIVRAVTATVTNRGKTRIVRTTTTGSNWVLRVPLGPGVNQVGLDYASRAQAGAFRIQTLRATVAR